MAKIAGITAFYIGTKSGSWQAGQKVPITSASVDTNYSEINVTDTGTTGDSEETIVSRAERTMKIDGLIYVSAAKKTGKDMALTFNDISYYLTSASYDESYSDINVTDTGTSGDGSETLISRAKRTIKVSAWLSSTVADIALGTAQATTLTFATGITVVGSAVPLTKAISAEINGASKVDYTFNLNTITETLPGLPTVGVEQDFKIVYKAGATTDKAIEGKCIITADSVSADVNGAVKFSLTAKINGAPTETVAN